MNDKDHIRELEARTLKAEGKLEDILDVLKDYTNTPLNGRVPTMALLQIGLIVTRGNNG